MALASAGIIRWTSNRSLIGAILAPGDGERLGHPTRGTACPVWQASLNDR